MDGKDDSGIDCEVTEQSKIAAAADANHVNDKTDGKCEEIIPQKNFIARSQEDLSSRSLKKSVELQKKIEKHRSNIKKFSSNINSQPKGILSRKRLLVPTKNDVASEADIQPLVVIDIDDSEEDEFAMPKLSKKAQREMAQQLSKDGYNLDLDPDEDDLDLIPPRPLNERCMCCNTQVNCCIQ